MRLGMIAAAICGISLLAASAQADERTSVRLLDNAQVAADGSSTVNVMPVRIGVGWRGGGYYPGWNRPYYSNGYYGGYNGYNGGYYRPYNGYYNTYRPYYGGYYRY